MTSAELFCLASRAKELSKKVCCKDGLCRTSRCACELAACGSCATGGNPGCDPRCCNLVELARVTHELAVRSRQEAFDAGAGHCLGDTGPTLVARVIFEERVDDLTPFYIDIGQLAFESWSPALLSDAELASYPEFHALNVGNNIEPELVAALLTSQNAALYPVVPAYAWVIFQRNRLRMVGPICPLEFESSDGLPEPIVDGVYVAKHTAIVFRDLELQALVEVHPPGSGPLLGWWLEWDWYMEVWQFHKA